MNHLHWSASEKKIARRAFEAALDKVLAKAMAEFKARAAAVTEPADMWDIGDDLYRKRREIDDLFDYRYSQLLSVFAYLIVDGLLELEDVAGLSEDKIETIQRFLAWRKSSCD